MKVYHNSKFIHLWKFIIIWLYSFMKTYYHLVLFIHESLSSFGFIYSWNSFTFYSFMKVSYSHHLCRIHAFSHIFFEHLHDFRTYTYVQIKIKFSKTAFLSKYCKFDTWSYSFLKLNHMISTFFNFWTWFALSSTFKFDHITFYFYEAKKKVSHEKKRFHMRRKKNSISLSCYSTLTRIHWISRYETWSSYHLEYRWL